MPSCLKLLGMWCLCHGFAHHSTHTLTYEIILLQGLDGKTALEVAKGPEVAEVLKKPEIATA